MAERRMFAKSVIGSARFLRMPSSSRLLYYDLGMQADDDGVVEAFSVMRTTGANEDDLQVLCARGFVQVLNDDLVAHITDWGRNNYIQKDRYRPSIYAGLLAGLAGETAADTWCIQSGYAPDTQDRRGKDRTGKDRTGEGRTGEGGGAAPVPVSVTPVPPVSVPVSVTPAPAPAPALVSVTPVPPVPMAPVSAPVSVTPVPIAPVSMTPVPIAPVSMTPAPQRFSPPTPEEVAAYCRERKSPVDPAAFVDYYAARGWRFGGGQAMRDWRAAVRSWEKRERPRPGGRGGAKGDGDYGEELFLTR